MCCALTAQVEMAQWCAVAERGRPFWCFPHEYRNNSHIYDDSSQPAGELALLPRACGFLGLRLAFRLCGGLAHTHAGSTTVRSLQARIVHRHGFCYERLTR